MRGDVEASLSDAAAHNWMIQLHIIAAAVARGKIVFNP